MNLNRREFLRLAGIIAAGASAGGACAPVYGRLTGAFQALGSMPAVDYSIFQALNRLTYGPNPASFKRAQEIGLAGWIEEQLAPATIEDGAAELLLRPFEALDMEANALEAKGREDVIGQLRAASLLRQVYSKRQLYERMVGFWTDHFNISVDKGDCWFLKVVDDQSVVRRHAMGRFNDLLLASAHSPAMLVYLDNQANKAGQPNENYAREVMELHTLGVDAGYSQADVMELARCLTGWTVKEHFWKGEFTFKDELHDQGHKRVLGVEIEPAGKAEAERVLAMLAGHPASAHHIASKLVQAFLVDDPSQQMPELVAKVAQVFEQTGGDVRSAMRRLLLDGLVPMAGQLPPKFKRPLNFVTSAVRAVGAETNGGPALQRWLESMGQPAFAWPTPDGPPHDSLSWQTSLLPRWQFALALTRDDIDGTSIPLEALTNSISYKDGRPLISEISRRLLGTGPQANLLAASGLVHRQVGQQSDVFKAVMVAGLLASPQFQWR